MASFGGAVEQQPPALPRKQHRCSSSDGVLRSSPSDAVFSDCRAPHCPIHQRYDASKHETRFFSEGTPPPIPRKRLTRTLSLPGSGAPSPPPFSPAHRCYLNVDNPLYMSAPIPDVCVGEEGEAFAPDSAPTSPSFSRLSFLTPDEQLCVFFQNFADGTAVSQRLQHRHLLFLRSTAQSVEARWLQGGAAALRSCRARDFLQWRASEPQRVGGQTFYRLHSSGFPERVLSLRVCTSKSAASPAPTQPTPTHANVRHTFVHLQSAASPAQSCSRPPHVAASAESGCSTGSPPVGGSSQSTVQSLLQGGFSVSIERDLPLATLEDFVLDCAERPGYSRQVCVLLLQVLMGSQHLHSTCAAAAQLTPQDVFLVWPTHHGGEHQAIREASGQHRGIQELWRRRGSPRVVLTPSPAPEPPLHVKHQVGFLIDFCLRPVERPGPASCSYQRGLRHLSWLLQREGGLQTTHAEATLQVLLWGPRRLHGSAVTVQHWLTTRRALLLMQMAESGLKQEPLFPDWEDCMRLRFLSFTDPETVASVAAPLWDALTTENQSQAAARLHQFL